MPKIVDQGVKKVMKTGKTKEQSYGIIIASLKKAGILDSKGKLTPLGIKRNAMSESARRKKSISDMKTGSKSRKNITKKK